MAFSPSTPVCLSQRDLLTDVKVAGTFGDGTARFTAAAAAAAERAASTCDNGEPASNPSCCEVSWGGAGGSGNGREDRDESARLAEFLSSALRGLADADADNEVRRNGNTTVDTRAIDCVGMTNEGGVGRCVLL